MLTDLPVLHREVCPNCMRPGGQCDLCNGTGYIYSRPYDSSRGIDAPDQAELELERLRAEVRRLAARVCCPDCGAEIERRAS